MTAPLIAVCSKDPSHEVKVDFWRGKTPMKIGLYNAYSISVCPTCGAPIVVKEKK